MAKKKQPSIIEVLEELPKNWFQLPLREKLILERMRTAEELAKMTNFNLSHPPYCRCEECR